MHESWENGTKTTSHGSLQRKGMDSTKTMGNDMRIVLRYHVEFPLNLSTENKQDLNNDGNGLKRSENN